MRLPSPYVRFLFILLLQGCARPYLDIVTDPPRDASLEEIRQLYQQEQESFPPLKGLMEVTLVGKARFWAKWESSAEGVKIAGFNLLGGSLFDFETQGTDTVHFIAAEGKGFFHGSRETFRQYLVEQAKKTTKRPLRMEWLTLVDWIARGGTPDLSSPDHMELEKQDNRFILYRFLEEGSKTLLVQKLFIERKAFRVTEVFLYDSDGFVETRIRFRDYRPPPGGADGHSKRTAPVGADGLTQAVASTATHGSRSFGVAVATPFQIEIEADDFYGKIVFKELHGNRIE